MANVTFRLLFLCYFILLPLLFLSGKNIQFPREFGSVDMFYMFPNIWKYLGYCGSWLVFFFLGIFIILVVGNEFSYKTLRQSVINGWTRNEVFISKLMLVWSVSSITTAYYVLNVLVIGWLNTDTVYMSKVLENVDYLPRYFVMCWGYMSFGLLLAILFRRTGLAIIFYFMYIMFLEPILRWWLHSKFTLGNSRNFYPMNAIEDLTPIPFPMQIPNEFKGQEFSLFLNTWEAFTVALISIFVFLFLAHRRLLKADL